MYPVAMNMLKYAAKPTAGACMALAIAICDDGDDDTCLRSKLEA